MTGKAARGEGRPQSYDRKAFWLKKGAGRERKLGMVKLQVLRERGEDIWEGVPEKKKGLGEDKTGKDAGKRFRPVNDKLKALNEGRKVRRQITVLITREGNRVKKPL